MFLVLTIVSKSLEEDFHIGTLSEHAGGWPRYTVINVVLDLFVVLLSVSLGIVWRCDKPHLPGILPKILKVCVHPFTRATAHQHTQHRYIQTIFHLLNLLLKPSSLPPAAYLKADNFALFMTEKDIAITYQCWEAHKSNVQPSYYMFSVSLPLLPNT